MLILTLKGGVYVWTVHRGLTIGELIQVWSSDNILEVLEHKVRRLNHVQVI